MNPSCLHIEVQRGEGWWFCGICKKGEREVVSEDITVTLPIFTPLRILPKGVVLREKTALLKETIKRERIVSLKRLLLIGFNRRKTLLGLRILTEGGFIIPIDKETSARLYKRRGSLIEGDIPESYRKYLEKLLYILSDNTAISRTELNKKLRWSKDTLDAIIYFLRVKGVIIELKGKRRYYRWNEGARDEAKTNSVLPSGDMVRDMGWFKDLTKGLGKPIEHK